MDADGKFFIRASEGEILPISYLGYTTKDCKAGSAPSISVLERSANKMDEAVVTAMDCKRKPSILRPKI